MLMIHGGAWLDGRGDARKMYASDSLAFRAQGWRVVNISYSPGPSAKADPRPMMRDVVAFYDQIRRAYTGPVCAYGDSAGGYLAAMLAIYRPSLNCAVLNAAPLDLPSLHTLPELVPYVQATFGTNPSMLAQWSPARDWRAGVDHTAIFASAAADDQIVPPQQLEMFHATDPSADVAVLQSGPFPLGHGTVDTGAFYGRVNQLVQWLDRIAPQGSHSSPRSAPDVGAGCDEPVPDADRFQLLLAGDAWQRASSPGQTIAATRGCSGSGYWQDDGLSLWALPSATAVLPNGSQASLALNPGRPIQQLTVSFRGFLARPQDWVLGVYTSTSTSGPIQTPVAVCMRGSCSGLSLYPTTAGAVLAPSGSRGDPDRSSQPPSASFSLPVGTRRIAWILICAARGGCSLKGISNVARISTRPRDPLGQPAIFSLYRVKLN